MLSFLKHFQSPKICHPLVLASYVDDEKQANKMSICFIVLHLFLNQQYLVYLDTYQQE